MEITLNLKTLQIACILRCGMLICAAQSTDYSVTEDGWSVDRRTFFSKTTMVEVEANGVDCFLAIHLEYLEKVNRMVSGKLVVSFDSDHVDARRVGRLVRFLTRKGLECYSPNRVIRCWDEVHNLTEGFETLQH